MQLVDKVMQDMEQVLDKTNIFTQITTRAGDPNAKSFAEFHTFTEERLQKIADIMPEINRATKSLGRSKTNTMKLMTLTMLADASPYRIIMQCLAQIEHKRAAIKENRFRLLKDRVKLSRLKAELGKCKEFHDKELIKIEIEEIATSISDTMLYIEGTLKSIASFQSAYLQVCRNKGIPKDWDETDLEKAEVEHHLRIAFLHAYRDIMATGRLGMGTLEYLQQFGVHPYKAITIIQDYINAITEKVRMINYEDFEQFLDECVKEFKNNYKQVMKKIGLDNLWETWYMHQSDFNKDNE